MFIKRQLAIIVMMSMGFLALSGYFLNFSTLREFTDKDAPQWYMIIAGFAAFFLIRIFVNSFLSFVSSSKGLAGSLNRVELRTISLLGLVSIPLLFFYTFYYSDVKALYTAFIVILLVVYLIRLFLLFTSASEHGIPVEYIFLYLCVLEITPLIAVGLWFTGAERVL